MKNKKSNQCSLQLHTLINYSNILTIALYKSDFEKKKLTNKLKIIDEEKIKNNLKIEASTNFIKEDVMFALRINKNIFFTQNI